MSSTIKITLKTSIFMFLINRIQDDMELDLESVSQKRLVHHHFDAVQLVIL